MVQQALCPACGGRGVTEKREHTVDRNETGEQVPCVRNYISPCTMCGGSRVVAG